jgi:hypothetical protein
MSPRLDSADARRQLPFRRDHPSASLVPLLLALVVPLLVVALLAGWRPPVPRGLAAAYPWLFPLVGPAHQQAVWARPAQADWALPNGHFYARSDARGEGGSIAGYAVTDAEGVPFWSEYRRLGGVGVLGYPLSNRFSTDEAAYQVFQRGVLQYTTPEAGATVVRLLDRLHEQGHDAELATRWGIPRPEMPLRDDVTPAVVAERAEWLLRDHPALAAYLAGLPDATALLGLPLSTVQDVGAYYAVRFHGGALQEWKEDVPWAKAGEVTAANIGEIAVALGAFPAEVLAPTPGPTPAEAAIS